MSTAALDETAAAPAPLRFRHLLVAVDGSEHAALALAEAIALAQRDHATITLLAVAPKVHGPVPGAFVAMDPAALQADVDSEVQATLRAATAQVPPDIPVTQVVRRGHPAQAILAQIREGGHDAVLLGARGLGRMAGLVGSISQHVMHHADIAVLVAHAPRPPGSCAQRKP
jgi:nucleotide-binding universal stress UspA family protein